MAAMESGNPYTLTSNVALLDEALAAGRDGTGHLSWSGRFGRYSYISWNMIYGGLSALLMALGTWQMLANTSFDISAWFDWPHLAYPDIFLWLGFWIGVITLEIITIIFDVRRLHDLNRSGYWVIPLLALQWGLAFQEIGQIPWEWTVTRLPLLVIPGTSGANRFGLPEPKRSPLLLAIGVLTIGAALVSGYYLAAYVTAG